MLDVAPIVWILTHLVTGTIMMVLLVATDFMRAICFMVARTAAVLFAVAVVTTIHSWIRTGPLLSPLMSPLMSLRIFAKPA